MQRTDILKKHNLLEILKTVKTKGPMTKPEIASATGLAGATVHNLVSELCISEIIIEDGVAASKGGRKASIFRFNPAKYHVIGVNIGSDSTSVIAFDLDINPIKKMTINFTLVEHSVEEGIEFIKHNINSFINEDPFLEKNNILGIGISVPGPVNSDEGIIIRLICAPSWFQIPLGSILSKSLNIPVFVGNDSNNTAIYLHDNKKNDKTENMVFVSTINGIGTGIIINGKLFHGSHFVSGEIGHISVNLSGEECSCGNRGCIEKQASEASIIKRAAKAVKKKQNTQIAELCSDNSDAVNMETIIFAAKENDAFALSLLESAAEYLSICIGDVIRTYDPVKIVINSSWLGQFPAIYNSIKHFVYEKNNLISRDSVSIDLIDEKDLFARGGAAVILNHHLNETDSIFIGS